MIFQVNQIHRGIVIGRVLLLCYGQIPRIEECFCFSGGYPAGIPIFVDRLFLLLEDSKQRIITTTPSNHKCLRGYAFEDRSKPLIVLIQRFLSPCLANSSDVCILKFPLYPFFFRSTWRFQIQAMSAPEPLRLSKKCTDDMGVTAF